MPNKLTYNDFSMQGLAKAFCEHFNVSMLDGAVKVDNEVGEMKLQALTLPGEMEVLFFEYDYKEDFFYDHTIENEQHFALWIDCCETTLQQIIIDKKYIEKVGPQQNYAYLMSTIFPYTQVRTKGTKGKSLIIFIPVYYLAKFLQTHEQESILAKFYALQNNRDSLIQHGEEEVKKVDSFFYQWYSNKNIFSITKYTYQLIEWYFTKLNNSLSLIGNENKLSPQQAVNLYMLQKHINDSLSLPNLDLSGLNEAITISINDLKKIFEKVHGKSIFEYFRESKITNAMKLVANTNKNISEIAYEFGYANPSNFSASFKKYYNITPQDYRKQLIIK